MYVKNLHDAMWKVSETHFLFNLSCFCFQVSDGIIAPGYEDEALEILKKKKVVRSRELKHCFEPNEQTFEISQHGI